MTNDRMKKTTIGWATQPSLDQGRSDQASASPPSYPQGAPWPGQYAAPPPYDVQAQAYARNNAPPPPAYQHPGQVHAQVHAWNNVPTQSMHSSQSEAAYPQPGQGAYPQPGQGAYPQPGQGAYPQPGQGAYPQYTAQPQPVYPSASPGFAAAPPQQPHGGTPAAASLYAAQQRPRAYAPAPPPDRASAEPGDASRPTHRTLRKSDAAVGASRRVRFIRLTYLHLLGAILAFAGLLYLFMTNEVLAAKVSVPLVTFALGGRANWGIVLAAFVAISWVADYWASHATSRAVQYAGLAFYVLAEALIFVPLLAIVEWKTQAILARGGVEPHIVRDSAYVTLGIFTALTASVFVSKKDFSFLRSGLAMASGAALSLIVLSLTFGFNLGLVFSVGMVLLAAGYVLYQTSQVLAHYDPRQHVAAALALFSSVALMFWYVIRIFLRARE
jgi:uncharacterized protein